MKKFFDKVMEVLPILWGVLWVAIITIGSVGAFVWVLRWVSNMIVG